MASTVVIAGEGEYESDRTMRLSAGDIRQCLGHEVTYCVPDVLEDVPNFPVSRFGGLEALAEAQLLVIYTRFRRLPDDQMESIVGYIRRGGPSSG